jgi:hypothetical protein
VTNFDKDWKLHTSLEVKLKFDQRGRLWTFENTTMQSSYAVAMVLSIFATEVQVVVTQITHYNS